MKSVTYWAEDARMYFSFCLKFVKLTIKSVIFGENCAKMCIRFSENSYFGHSRGRFWLRAAFLLMGWRWLVGFGQTQKVSSRVWAVIWVEQLMLFFCPAGWPDVPLLALLGFCPAKILFMGLTIYLIA